MALGEELSLSRERREVRGLACKAQSCLAGERHIVADMIDAELLRSSLADVGPELRGSHKLLPDENGG